MCCSSEHTLQLRGKEVSPVRGRSLLVITLPYFNQINLLGDWCPDPDKLRWISHNVESAYICSLFIYTFGALSSLLTRCHTGNRPGDKQLCLGVRLKLGSSQ